MRIRKNSTMTSIGEDDADFPIKLGLTRGIYNGAENAGIDACDLAARHKGESAKHPVSVYIHDGMVARCIRKQRASAVTQNRPMRVT